MPLSIRLLLHGLESQSLITHWILERRGGAKTGLRCGYYITSEVAEKFV